MQRPIDGEIKERTWGWIGHTLRRPDGHVAKTAHECDPQRKRKRGGSRHTLRRTKMLELEERGLTWREAKVTAQNEVRWRALEEDICSMRNEDD